MAGLAAARAVLSVRPQDVRHIAYAPEARKLVAELLRTAAQHRIAYRELPSAELDKLAGTLHHEGVSLQVRARPALRVDGVIRALADGGFALALDRVRNPHNIGALLRSAAYFGARALLIGSDGGEPRLTPAAVRTAEGGAEHVGVCFAPELCDALDRLARAGVCVVGADAHGGEPLARTRFGERCVLVLGNEREGLSPAVRRRCASQVRIPGSGRVDSLNVSVAAGILLAHAAAEQARANRAPSATRRGARRTRGPANTGRVQRRPASDSGPANTSRAQRRPARDRLPPAQPSAHVQRARPP